MGKQSLNIGMSQILLFPGNLLLYKNTSLTAQTQNHNSNCRRHCKTLNTLFHWCSMDTENCPASSRGTRMPANQSKIGQKLLPSQNKAIIQKAMKPWKIKHLKCRKQWIYSGAFHSPPYKILRQGSLQLRDSLELLSREWAPSPSLPNSLGLPCMRK